MRRKIQFILLPCMLLALPYLVFAQGADSSSTATTPPATIEDHSLQDPIIQKPHEWHSSALKPGWGVSAEYQAKLTEFNDDESDNAPRNNIVVTGYYDTWALSILTRHQFTGARLAFRDTRSRDLLSSWYLVGGSTNDIKQDSFVVDGGMTFGIGSRSVYGYDQTTSFLATYDFEVGLAAAGGESFVYLYTQALLGFRVPVQSVAISLGLYVDASIGASALELDSDYDFNTGQTTYTYTPNYGVMGAVGVSITVGFNGNVLQ